MNAMDGPGMRPEVSRRPRAQGEGPRSLAARRAHQSMAVKASASWGWLWFGRRSRVPSLCLRADRACFGPDLRPVLFTLNSAQKEKYLFPRFCAGRRRPPSRSRSPMPAPTPGPCETTAVRKGDHYIINGYKALDHQGAGLPIFLQLVAATDRSKGSRGGLSMFLVDTATPRRQDRAGVRPR